MRGSKTQSIPTLEDLLTYEQAAELLSVDKETIRGWVKRGLYRRFKLRGTQMPYLSRSELERGMVIEIERDSDLDA